MPSAWSGTIGDLKNKITSGIFIREIAEGFSSHFTKPSDSQLQAWQFSLPALVDALSKPKFNSVQVIIELQMPIGAERADVVLLGGSASQPKAYVIELKQWSRIRLFHDTREILIPHGGLHQHPSIQALNYSGKLHFFNSHAHNYAIRSAVYLHNASPQDKRELSLPIIPSEWLSNAPLIAHGEEVSLERLIENLLPCTLPPNEHITFSQAPYDQSQHLFTFLQEHSQDIAKEAAFSIANTGMGLTVEQERLKNEIICAVSSNKGVDFIIQGNPGSGKTLLAVSLLLKAAEQKKKVILALRNNRLQAILRQIFNNSYPGASGMMEFFEPMGGGGIARFPGHVDLLICDEAQRMESRIMSTVLQKADTCAIFLDETQRLNPPEQGTQQSFSQASRSVGRHPELRQLTASVRVPIPYVAWLETLLANPFAIDVLRRSQPWKSDYTFLVCNNVQELLDQLKLRRSFTCRVALVASFTESKGNMSINHPENLRIGYPLQSGFDLYKNSSLNIPWLMTAEHYRQFWIGGTSNRLDRIASIYGAQGFESDYVGVIWGRDLLYRENRWILGNPQHCYDAIDRLLTIRNGHHTWSQDALPLVLNRYRIFLTRGIRGTLVFCEDEQTSLHLQSLLK